MKASELIKELQKVIDENGDVEIYGEDCERENYSIERIEFESWSSHNSTYENGRWVPITVSGWVLK